MGEDGGPFYVITEYSKENIQAVVKGLDHKSTINWHNIPKEHKEEAELECLRHAKKATFDDGKGPVATTLSKLMPEQPGDWQGWLKNIEDSQERVKSSLKSKLVQKVVGDNPEKLNEFWANISATKDPKLIKSTYDCMNPGQKKALDQSYIEQLGALLVHQDSLEKKLESKLEAAQTKAKLSSVMKEYAELLGREFKPERINKKLEEVNKSLENKQTKLSPELKREFDKFIEKVSDQAYGGGEKKKEQKKEEQKEEEEKKPSLNI